MMTSLFKFAVIGKLKDRYKQLGIIVFLFFLIKGLLWLIVPALIVYFGIDYSFQNDAE